MLLSVYKTNSRLIKEELRAAYKAQIVTSRIISDGSLAMWCEKMLIGEKESKIRFLSGFLPRLKGEQKREIEESLHKGRIRVRKHG